MSSTMSNGSGLPPSGANNFWYVRNDSPSVVIFVHGIVSDSLHCWLADSGESHCYWPQLVSKDARLHYPSIFLGGFYTAVDAGKYDIADCAKELFGGLVTPDNERQSPPIEKKRLVFICHSTGGIVVRYMLLNNAERFRDKEVCLVLLASPSYGSRLADQLGGLASFYDNQLAKHLRWGNDLLKDLDDRFKELVDRKTIPNLLGVEGCENHFVIHRKWLPDRSFVVERESAGRYFTSRMLANTDHSSIVKPDGLNHPSHQLLVECWTRWFGVPLGVDLQTLLDASKADMRARNLPYFTPALLLALLHPQGVASSVVNSVRVGLADELRARFWQYLDVELPQAGAGGFSDFDWFDKDDVRRAQKFAHDDGISTVTEQLLFRSVLCGDSSTVKQMKKQQGQEFNAIVIAIERRGRHAPATPGYRR